MQKNTLLAIVLSVAVLIIFSVVQGTMYPRQPPETQGAPPGTAETPRQEVSPGQPAPQAQPAPQTQEYIPPPVSPDTPNVQPDVNRPYAPAGEGPAYENRVTIKTDLLEVTLSNIGGDVVSLKLLQHRDKDGLVEMILPGNNTPHAFTVALGNLNALPVSEYFNMSQTDYSVEFYRDFIIPSYGGAQPAQFRLTKRYEFKKDDYMFELTVSLDGGFTVPGFNFSGAAYTLSFGPQIGPRFEKLDNRYDYRQYFTYNNGKRKTEKPGSGIINTGPKWAAVSGKYFACIAVPLLPQYDLNFSETPEPGLPSASRLNIIRPPLNSSRVDDTYRFYLGPKSQDVLNTYNTGNNEFGLRDMQVVEVANTRGFLAPLEKLLKWLLIIFYKLAPNYGIAIILLTLLVKILFFPLTRKGSEATLRMQAVAPKIKELQEKYKSNPQKMNAEMAELYKREGYNPLSGCLPMLLQLPIFIAMYNLFNNHFDLRGAMFIPGWIPDLSVPEAIWNFPDGARLPLLGWTALRLLPFIYVGSQLLYGKVTQTPGQANNTQMKIMLYALPIVFFFVLYDMPSGLLVYWIFSNLLTMVQQIVINKFLAKKRAAQAEADAAAAAAAAAAAPVPPKKKKR